jgi:hypothetical protein
MKSKLHHQALPLGILKNLFPEFFVGDDLEFVFAVGNAADMDDAFGDVFHVEVFTVDQLFVGKAYNVYGPLLCFQD